MKDELRVYSERRADFEPTVLERAIDRVGENVLADDRTRTAIRDIAWFLQESMHMRILGSLRLEERPDIARQRELFEKGVAHGIETLCAHITESGAVSELSKWLHESEE